MMLFLLACTITPPSVILPNIPTPRAEGELAGAADSATPEPPGEAPLVILVSFDGFRADYLSAYETPSLDRLAARGVVSEGLVPVFPTKTFPNHYTQVTGLYPDSHGIVGNTFYDPGTQSIFTMSSTESHWWGGEPIWVTAEKQGLSAATCYWVGSEAAIQGVRPSRWLTYDGSLSDADRVDLVLSWIDEPEPPALVTVYFSQVDSAGHRYGPLTDATEQAVGEVDAALGRLLDGLETRGLQDKADVVVVSDHGMAQLSPERMIFLDDHIDTDDPDVYILSWGAMVPLDVPEARVDEALAALADVPHLTCAPKDNTPAHWHHGDNERIASVLCVADAGWSVSTRSWFEGHSDSYGGGTHGYDPLDVEMHGVFLARGPHFAEGVTVAPFESVEVYNLLARALGVVPADNDGDLSRIPTVLRPWSER